MARPATWASRSRSSSRSRATSPRTRPSSSMWTTSRSTIEQVEVHERHFSYGAVDEAFAAADVVVEGRFEFPRWSCTPVECYGVVADWRGDGLTAWANFQGPVHAARRRGRRARHPRRQAAPADPSRLGRLVRHQVVRVRVRRPARSRLARARGPGPLDGGSTRAPGCERARHRTRDPPRGGVRGGRRAARPALRRARGRRRVRPRAGAGDALPHARIALRRLPRPATSPRATASR